MRVARRARRPTLTSGRNSIIPPSDRDHVAEYAARAPLALALERSLECQLYVGRELVRPVLDIGCGDGCFIEVLLGGSTRVDYGLDPDAHEAERARQRGVYLEVLEADAGRIPLAADSIGTVIANSTLEHVPHIEVVLGEIRRVLQPGGRIFATVPTDKFDRYAAMYRVLARLGSHAAAERYRSLYDRFWKHVHFQSPADWQRLLERTGFEVEEVREYCPSVRCTIHDLLVPLAFPTFFMKKAIGRYYLVPPLRRAAIRLVRPALPPNALAPVAPGAGGLVFLVARRPDEDLRR